MHKVFDAQGFVRSGMDTACLLEMREGSGAAFEPNHGGAWNWDCEQVWHLWMLHPTPYSSTMATLFIYNDYPIHLQ